jgi:putative protease
MTSKLSLPLIGSEETPTAPRWHDWTVVPPATDAPEPREPQGEYHPLASSAPLVVPSIDDSPLTTDHSLPTELLSPAGGSEAAFAAFHYGADAIYLGLKKYSARAEAENFTLAELDEITAYAHSLEPRRRVFVTINTLIRQDELPELIETLAALTTIGVDALIVQDLGVYWAVRRYFPELELHASTQMAVHNRAGAEILKRLGFSRVVLARELTFEEVRDITATSCIETEVFVHGALCYSYSGLCLFSAQTLGRSGNRGKCAYSCRDTFEVTGAPTQLRDGSATLRDPGQGFPFSMKDLALPDHIPALRAAGVSCFKIEGRKKSPLYVATTTDYYRKLLEGTLAADEREGMEADLHTVFSRPWTRLFVQSHKDKEVADRDTVGHRGALIGTIEAIVRLRSSDQRQACIHFRTNRALEQHDGLQIDLPSQGTPFGFAVDKLWIVSPRRQEVFQAPAGSLVEVPLPDDYPTLPIGAPVYCSSSQAVKQSYRYFRPKAGLHRVRQPLEVNIEITPEGLTAEAVVGWRAGRSDALRIHHSLAGPFPAAQDKGATDRALESAFARLGNSPFILQSLKVANAESRFVPVSRLNQLRREIIDLMEKRLAERQSQWITEIMAETRPPARGASFQLADSGRLQTGPTFRWSIKIDRIGYVDTFTDEDWQNVDEVIIDIARDHPRILSEKLRQLGAKIGPERVRLALPPLTRKWEEKGLLHKIDELRSAGWNRWEAGNLSAWSYLELPAQQNRGGRGRYSDPGAPAGSTAPFQTSTQTSAASAVEKFDRAQGSGVGVPTPATPEGHHSPPPTDIATDWSVYVINRLAARQLLDMGVSRFALSPEDGLENMRSLLAEFGERAVVIVHQDTPLFLAESCAYANLIGGCPGKANCKFESMEMVSSHGEKVTALDYHCRTIVLNHGPFCLSTRLGELAGAGAVSVRADFVYRPYQSDEVRERWRQVRAGRAVPGGHFANFERGIL